MESRLRQYGEYAFIDGLWFEFVRYTEDGLEEWSAFVGGKEQTLQRKPIPTNEKIRFNKVS